MNHYILIDFIRHSLFQCWDLTTIERKTEFFVFHFSWIQQTALLCFEHFIANFVEIKETMDVSIFNI